MNKLVLGLTFALTAGASSLALSADPSEASHHHPMGVEMPMAMPAEAAGPMNDPRRLVEYPEPMRIHTLANMRDHLATLAQIQDALAHGAFDKASNLAEQRLGMSSLQMHGAHELAMYMPKGMQEAGTAMHHTASQFAIVAKDASVTGDLKPVLASLARLNETCVACHAAYRLH
jgi:hypothetical protein